MTAPRSGMIRTVAAGVGGTGGWRALAWAAREADESRARLVLLRVSPSGSPLAALAGRPPVRRLERADPELARAVAATGARPGGHRELRILAGEPETALAAAATGADLLVIGAEHAGDTTRRIVRLAPCPVVVVHPPPAGPGPFAGDIVVGLGGDAAGRAALDFAFSYADAHRLPLTVAYVDPESPGDCLYDESTPSARVRAEPAARRLLNDAVEPRQRRHPRVRARRAVLRGRVADGLLRAGPGARLLVVGERHRTPYTGGDVPLTLAGHARCPVAVVPYDEGERP
jgi:nucleotide-binding universal stress UspA family protein